MDKKSARTLVTFLGALQIIPLVILGSSMIHHSVKYGKTSDYDIKSEIVSEANCDSCATYFSQRADSENPDSKNFGKFPKDSLFELRCDSALKAYQRSQTEKEIEKYSKSSSYFIPSGF